MGGSYQTLESGSGVANQVATCIRVRVSLLSRYHRDTGGFYEENKGSYSEKTYLQGSS